MATYTPVASGRAGVPAEAEEGDSDGAEGEFVAVEEEPRDWEVEAESRGCAMGCCQSEGLS